MYVPLPAISETGQTPPFTRLLTLFPGTGSAPLVCSLQIVDIERSPWRFEALSYVWGREHSPRPLLCGQTQIPIAVNLEHALYHLRLPTLYRILWVDAVCINQQNLEERARQTGYMKRIYQQASLVIAWLGPSVPGTQEAFAFARQLSELQKDMTPSTSDNKLDQNQEYSAKSQTNTILYESLAAGEDATVALIHLCARDYFERVWCIQEVVSSQQCIAKCGVHEMNFFDLLSLFPHVWEFRNAIEDRQGKEFHESTGSFWSLILHAKQQSSGRPVQGSMGSLLNLLRGIRNFKCTDPRDRIFALLGISDEGIQPVMALTQLEGGLETLFSSMLRRGASWLANNINSLGPGLDFARHPALAPNYTKPVQAVYRDFTRFNLRKSPRTLDILSLVQHIGDPFDDPWPSWVPKLHEHREVSIFPTSIYLSGIPFEGHYPYFAELHDSPLYGESQYPDILRLDGYRVDQVETVSEAIVFGMTSPIPVEKIWAQLFPFPLFPRPTQQYTFNGEALDIAFFTVLMAGTFGPALTLAGESLKVGNSRTEGWKVLGQQGKRNLLAWLEEHTSSQTLSYNELATRTDAADLPGSAAAYVRSVWAYSLNRRVYRTKSGLIGLGPRSMQPGDLVTVFLGGGLPFILRRKGLDWKLIGDTYLHHEGILRGQEAIKVRSPAGKHRIETFGLT